MARFSVMPASVSSSTCLQAIFSCSIVGAFLLMLRSHLVRWISEYLRRLNIISIMYLSRCWLKAAMLAQLSKRSDLLTEYERLHLKKPNMRSHNERCRECKDSFQTLLAARFGAAERNWELDLPCKVSEYKHSKVSDLLLPIHDALQRYRGYADFVRSNRLSKADFFVPGPSLIFEFDESQHFTNPRDIALSHYPENREVGFSKTR